MLDRSPHGYIETQIAEPQEGEKLIQEQNKF